MALNGSGLGDEIEAAMKTVSDKFDTKTLWRAIAGAIVKHFQTNGEIPAGITVSTTGSATAQQGATTSMGKII